MPSRSRKNCLVAAALPRTTARAFNSASGGGSKRALGRPLQTPHLLDLSRLAGIRDYAPSELVLTAGAATPLAEIERALAERGQMLAFEPPNWRGLLGGPGEPPSEPTLGGALACNLSGPRRIKTGAARDHS